MPRKSDETAFQVGASALVHAVFGLASKAGRVVKGTYNTADPTAYEHVTCYLTYEMDPYLLKDYWSQYQPTEEELKEMPADQYTQQRPPSACYELVMKNVTWGTEVTLTFENSEIEDEKQDAFLAKASDKKVFREQVFSFYLDHAKGEILWVTDHERDNLVKDFLLGCITGECEFLGKPFKYVKDMDENELKALELEEQMSRWDAAMRRNTE